MEQNYQGYRAVLTGEPFLYFEMKVVAKLMLQGLSMADMKSSIVEQNLFQHKTDKSITKAFNAVYDRLQSLDLRLIQLMTESSSEVGKLIAFYAIAKTDRLFKEFMLEVYCEKKLTGQKDIEDVDFKIYFNSKAEQSDTAAKWHDNTLKKLQQVFIQILTQSGLVSDRRGRLIATPVVEPRLKQLLEQLGEGERFRQLIGG